MTDPRPAGSQPSAAASADGSAALSPAGRSDATGTDVDGPVTDVEVLPARVASARPAVWQQRAAALRRVAADLAHRPAVVAAASAVGSQIALAAARRIMQPGDRGGRGPQVLVVFVSTHLVALADRRQEPRALPPGRAAVPPGGIEHA